MHLTRRPISTIGVLLCVLLRTPPNGRSSGFAVSASAAQVNAAAQPRIPMLDEGKGLIHLDVSVTGADGESKTGLSREDFELVDEDRPQKILSFHAFDGESARPDPPVQVILFFDSLCGGYSSCMSKADALRAQAGIESFLSQNDGHLNQPVSVFGISDYGLWTVPDHDSTNGNLLASDLSSGKMIVLSRRPDALRALGFIASAQRRKRGRKVMLWIGPGCGKGTGIFPASHNQGHKSFDQIYWFTTLVREARLTIDELAVDEKGPCAPGYQLYLDGARTVRDANDRFLYKKVLAIQSGGSVVNESNDLVEEVNRCVGGARTFYTLSFDPPVAREPHEYHSLRVRVNKPGLLAQTTIGYYDEPFYSDQPNPALQRITVGQLGLIMRDIGRGRNSGDSGKRLAYVELTERLGLANFVNGTAEFSGGSAQQALTRLADASSFLAPPPAEIPKQGAPDGSAQERMLARARDYLEELIPKLPNFHATRTTVHYEETAQLIGDWTHVDYRPLHVVETERSNVLFRAGDEVLELKGAPPQTGDNRLLTTYGTFGPILAELRRPMETPGRMKWVRWEKGPEGIRAVFGFEIPAAESRDFEGGCCLPDAEGTDSYRIQAGYHGEIAIDPATGTIVRVQLQFDLREYVPEDVDEILIDYGPVKIGGRTYICPVRSVSIVRGRSIASLTASDESFLSYGPYTTKMNEIRFSNYHVFRSESRILPGFTPAK